MNLSANEKTTLFLPAGQVLSVVAASGASGSAIRMAKLPGGGDAQSITAIAGADLSFGPYAQTERFEIICTAGTLTIATAVPVPDTDSAMTANSDNRVPSQKAVKSAIAAGVAGVDSLSELLPATAENDFIVAGADPFAWAKKTLDQTKAIIGLPTPTAENSFLVSGADPFTLAEKTLAQTLAILGRGAAGEYVLPEKTPINAVAASKTLTFTGNAEDSETVSIGGQSYKFQIAIGDAVAASGLLTVADTPHEGETVVIGGKTYKWRAAIGAGVKASKALGFTGLALASEAVTIGTQTWTFVTALTEAKAAGVLTASANPQDGARVTIGSTTYTFRDTLAVAYDVKIGATAEESLLNLVEAITYDDGDGTNEGEDYGTGTEAHPSVTAAEGALDTVDVTALAIGIAGNLITSVEYSPGLEFVAGTLLGGLDAVLNEVVIGGDIEGCIDNLVAAVTGAAGAGTTYSTGTAVCSTCDCVKTDATTFTATAKAVGFAGNDIALDEDLTNGAWAAGAVFLSGGVDAAVENDVLFGANAEAAIDNLVLAITGGATEGVNYGTGTTASTEVTAVKASAATMTVTAIAAGEVGNTIATTTAATHCSFAAGTLTGGEGLQAANDVLIGGTPELSIDNLVAAIAGTGQGTTCGAGTIANTSVTAVKVDADKIKATAKVKGVIGNSIVIAKTVALATWADGATALSGGIDGTVGVANETCADGTNLYHCIATNTVADANWRKVELGSAF